MGWKSTINITRKEAKRLILQSLMKKITFLDSASDKELEDLVESLGYGEDTNLEYFGHNFIVTDKIDDRN